MNERRWGNFNSCCRLCLSEKLGTLKSIFEDASLGQDVVVNIQEFVGVEIKPDDKLSTLVCDKCNLQVQTWKKFKASCFNNQSKLELWMNEWNSNTSIEDLNMSIRIKDEILEDDETDNPTEDTSDGEIHVKSEPIDPIDAIYHVETEMHSDDYEYPPPLSPVIVTEPLLMEQYNPRNSREMNGSVSVEPEKEQVVVSDGRKCLMCNKSFSSVANRHRHDAVFHRGAKRKSEPVKVSVEPEKGQVSSDGKTCLTCNKSFSSVTNRHRHDAVFHRGTKRKSEPEVSFEPEKGQVSPDGKSCLMCNKSFSSVANRHRHDAVFHRGAKRKSEPAKGSETNKKPAVANNLNGEVELQKIQFAAGLQLKQRSAKAQPVALEDMALTKTEQSYLDKCKTIINMTDTLTCVCHNEKFDQVRDLHIHLKKQRQWFAMFTCYNCLITYTERSSYMKHFCCCSKDLLQNLRRLTESPINPEIKMRLYQNYKCLRCNCIFGFYEDFCSHFDVEHMELLQNSAPYVCFCSKSFDEMDDYRQHLHIACFLRYFCDVCFEVYTTVEEFRAHCEEEHDNAEPGNLQPYDPFSKPKSGSSRSGTPALATRRSLQIENVKKEKNDDLRHLTRRRTINLPSSENSSQVSDMTADVEEVEDPDYNPELNKNSQSFQTLKSSNPAACPECGKMYSTYHNMLRHYKLSHDETGKILECRFCDEKFRLITELKDHEANEHGAEDVKDESDFEDPSRQFNFSCPDCGALFKNNDDWTKHMETHPKKVCDECDKEFLTQAELDNHRSVHLNIKVYRDSKTQDYKSAMVSPSLICEVCDKTFSTKSELRHHKLLHEKIPVLSAPEGSLIEEKADLSKKFSCIPCDKHYVSYGGIWDHNKKHHPNQQIAAEYPKKCALCSKMISSRGAWSNHEKMHERLANMKRDIDDDEPRNSKHRNAADSNDDDSESYHTCKRCFKVFSSKYNLKNHMKCHGINLNPSRSSTKTGKIIKTYWCNICHQACPGYAELQEHKREHASENRATIKQELDTEDRKPVVFECDECSLTFQTSFALARHQEKHIRKQESSQKLVSVYCKYCKVPFPSVSDLNEHMDKDHSDMVSKPKVQTPGTKHICKLCKKVFDNAGALASHQGWHKRVKFNRVRAQEQLLKAMSVKKQTNKSSNRDTSYNFPCSDCSEKFPTDSSLQIHILEAHRNINTTVLIMKCNSCKMSFDKKSAFDIHMQLHRQVESKSSKPFSCKYCPAGFSRVDTLNLHIKQHHKEFIPNVLKCTYCERTFDKQNALTVHLKVHERQKLAGDSASPKPTHNKPIYFCSICDLGFAIAKDLRNHVLSAHPF